MPGQSDVWLLGWCSDVCARPFSDGDCPDGVGEVVIFAKKDSFCEGVAREMFARDDVRRSTAADEGALLWWWLRKMRELNKVP